MGRSLRSQPLNRAHSARPAGGWRAVMLCGRRESLAIFWFNERAATGASGDAGLLLADHIFNMGFDNIIAVAYVPPSPVTAARLLHRTFGVRPA